MLRAHVKDVLYGILRDPAWCFGKISVFSYMFERDGLFSTSGLLTGKKGGEYLISYLFIRVDVDDENS